MAVSVIIWSWNDIKKDRVKDLQYTSSVIKRYYELSFNQWRNTLLNLGQRLATVEGDSIKIKRARILKESIKNYDELLAFGYASPEGKILAFSSSEMGDSLPDLMASENSRRSFLKVKNADRISIGEVYYFPSVKDWILPLRVPIRNESGEVLAVNTTALQYERIIRDLGSFGFNNKYKIHLINNEFNVSQVYFPLARARYDEVLQRPVDFYRDEIDATVNEMKYQEVINELEDLDMLMVSVPLSGLNHTLNIMVDKSIVWDEFRPILLSAISLYVLLVLASFALFNYINRKQDTFNAMLVSREANLKAIFESTNSIIGLFDVDKKLVEFNQAFSYYAKITDGITLRRGLNVFDKMNNKEMAAAFQGFQDRALAGGKFSETVDYATENGNIHFLLSYNPIYQNDRITGISMFVEDITELKTYQEKLEKQTENLENTVQSRTSELQEKNVQLEVTLRELEEAQERLVQSEKMASLGILAAGIGHEINNPLNFIKNGAAALLLKLKEREIILDEFNPFFQIIETGVSRANNIVKSLSHFSREVKSMEELCDINAVLDNCLTILYGTYKDKISITKNLDSDIPKVFGNEGKLHQVFLNLLSNAEQAIVEQGEIVITTKYDENRLIVTIADNGCGISPSNLSKISDPFFTTKSPGEGTGLGLYIAYNIIEEHNGEIRVKSKLSEGTIFIVELKINK